MRKFRFGIAEGFQDSKGTESWRETLLRGQDLGFTSYHVGEHMGPMPSPLPIALAAALWSQMRVSTHVLCNDFHHPVMLAKEAATIDLLTGGRLEIGIGAGYDYKGPPDSPMTSEWKQIGKPFDSAGVRLSRLAEALTVIKRFLHESEPFSFAGDHYRFEGVEPLPRPAQRHLPIAVGGSGRRVLELAAREANIVNFAPRPAHGIHRPTGVAGLGIGFQEQLAIVKAAAGPRFGELELATFTTMGVITSDVRGTIDRFASNMQTTADDIEAMPSVLVGEPEAIVGRLVADRERFGLSYRVVGWHLIDAFGPIVSRLAGT